MERADDNTASAGDSHRHSFRDRQAQKKLSRPVCTLPAYAFCRTSTVPSVSLTSYLHSSPTDSCLLYGRCSPWFGVMEQVLDALYHTLVLEQHVCLPEDPTMDSLLAYAENFLSSLRTTPLPSTGKSFIRHRQVQYTESC